MLATPISIWCVVLPPEVCVASWKKKSPPRVMEPSIVRFVLSAVMRRYGPPGRVSVWVTAFPLVSV